MEEKKLVDITLSNACSSSKLGALSWQYCNFHKISIQVGTSVMYSYKHFHTTVPLPLAIKSIINDISFLPISISRPINAQSQNIQTATCKSLHTTAKHTHPDPSNETQNSPALVRPPLAPATCSGSCGWRRWALSPQIHPPACKGSKFWWSVAGWQKKIVSAINVKMEFASFKWYLSK